MKEWDRKLEEGESGTGPGPTPQECLMFAGHVGVSFEAESPIYGFNPDTGAERSHAVMNNLFGHKSYPGHVTDDTSIFQAARARGLTVLKRELIYPESQYNEIKSRFDAEKAGTGYKYGFPPAGDCNCATFPQKVGIPVPEATGRMKQYAKNMSALPPQEKMGECEG